MPLPMPQGMQLQASIADYNNLLRMQQTSQQQRLLAASSPQARGQVEAQMQAQFQANQQAQLLLHHQQQQQQQHQQQQQRRASMGSVQMPMSIALSRLARPNAQMVPPTSMPISMPLSLSTPAHLLAPNPQLLLPQPFTSTPSLTPVLPRTVVSPKDTYSGPDDPRFVLFLSTVKQLERNIELMMGESALRQQQNPERSTSSSS